ncbi:MAG: hypothetical protein AAGF73_14085 [Actinomycetota bacterium]
MRCRLQLRADLLAALGAFALVVTSSCTGGDGAGQASAFSTSTVPVSSSFADDDPTSPVVVVDGTTGSGSTLAPVSEPTIGSTATSSTSAATTTLATVPDTGVPGLDSELPFCQAWSTFAGSFQALALAAGFAADPTQARRAELAASPALLAALAAIDQQLPAELEAERGVLVDDALGPLQRRAERNVEALRAAGLTDAELESVGAAWLDALAITGVDDPEIAPSLPAMLAEIVAVAADAIAGEIPPINQDPSLVTDTAFPASEAYLVANCPDQGTLAGNDIIDG